jgi:hypothetical protein
MHKQVYGEHVVESAAELRLHSLVSLAWPLIQVTDHALQSAVLRSHPCFPLSPGSWQNAIASQPGHAFALSRGVAPLIGKSVNVWIWTIYCTWSLHVLFTARESTNLNVHIIEGAILDGIQHVGIAIALEIAFVEPC